MNIQEQQNHQAEIQQVEHLFFATINGNEVLFLQPKGENEPKAYHLTSVKIEHLDNEIKLKV